MRAIWSGSLSFGLVNIPIKLYSAVEPKELSFNLLHKTDLSPIRFARVCRKDGKEIPYEDIVKGYEYEEGDYVVMDNEDFKKANVRETSTIEILSFAEASEIDPLLFEKPYYLEPDKSKKSYALLAKALKKTKKVGVAKFVMRDREHLAVVRPEDNLIILEQLRFKHEIRGHEELKLPDTNEVGEREVALAVQLIEQLTAPFDPDEYKDTYSDDLKQIIEAKAKGKSPRAKGVAPQPMKINDLMTVLKKSLEKEKQR
jgi:DNA end-binding protein Ku